MPCRLSKKETMTMEVLAEHGVPKAQIAKELGVVEGTVRYHLKRIASGAEDGRRDKPFKAASQAAVIEAWFEECKGEERALNIRDLHEFLVREHSYAGSYQSTRRYVRSRFPAPKIRPYRRVETVAGAQTQTDWGEFPGVDVGEGPQPLHAFVMVLSHSRKPALVWSRREDQVSWLHCHNEAYRRLAGVAAVNRIDNVKTAVVTGAGAWGEIHEVYRAYARAVGFHIDACAPGEANAKGKVEAKVRLGRLRADPTGRRFEGMEELQGWSDERLETWAKCAICPATGRTVEESWERELERLAPLALLPEPFDVVVTRPVHRDCTVNFEGRVYAVPFVHVGELVEVRGCAGKVQILAEGRVVREYPRHTEEKILLDPSCYEGVATERVAAPVPLGRMGRRLAELAAIPVERRPLDLYAALAEVAR
jgi:transposase